MNDLRQSFSAGYSCLAAWAELLNQINVFPVADGDTGTNLRISLAPLRHPEQTVESVRSSLTRSATGNSGNIAAPFFRELYLARDFSELAEKADLGRQHAWRSLAAPRAGTMLTVFDILADFLSSHRQLNTVHAPLRLALEQGVFSTTQLLPHLREAGVVDSGALAMYAFFDGFFHHLTGAKEQPPSLFDIFAGRLAISSSYRPEITGDHCVDAVLRLNQATRKGSDQNGTAIRGEIAGLGESVVVVEDETVMKIHVHTGDPDGLKGRLGSLGDIVQWSDTAIEQSGVPAAIHGNKKPCLHIITDAAGSLTREMARGLGITLLDSYIVAGEDCRPESLYDAEQIYPLLRQGIQVTTGQASRYERQQYYRSICQQHGPSLYLCVGSAFTGNFEAATTWQKTDPMGDRLTVIDTGAASGRLAVIALLTGRRAYATDDPGQLTAYAQRLCAACQEYVFINELKYLVAGGRVSRASGFFGDLLHMKPVISPTSDGVKKMGVVRSAGGQVDFAMDKLAKFSGNSSGTFILLQYSDNEDWVMTVVLPRLQALLPEAETHLVPLSLTSGVHMGPGTWSVAFAPPPVPPASQSTR